MYDSYRYAGSYLLIGALIWFPFIGIVFLVARSY